uniref:Uncharacterized protein n=1 Tax=Salarias fasciatus TaxID=181472 RepID=A0A672FH97_SALFA
ATDAAVGAEAAAVGRAVAENTLTHRQCFIEIMNGCCNNYFKSFPPPNRWYVYSGSCASPFPPTVPSNALGSALFIKTPHTACGSVGVVTYDLLHDDDDQPSEKIAVMFSNPYDFNLFSNWYAVGIFDKSKQCDYDLYSEMYYGSSESFIRGQAGGEVLSHTGQRVSILATMSDANQPIVKVVLRERNINCL